MKGIFTNLKSEEKIAALMKIICYEMSPDKSGRITCVLGNMLCNRNNLNR